MNKKYIKYMFKVRNAICCISKMPHSIFIFSIMLFWMYLYCVWIAIWPPKYISENFSFPKRLCVQFPGTYNSHHYNNGEEIAYEILSSSHLIQSNLLFYQIRREEKSKGKFEFIKLKYDIIGKLIQQNIHKQFLGVWILLEMNV